MRAGSSFRSLLPPSSSRWPLASVVHFASPTRTSTAWSARCTTTSLLRWPPCSSSWGAGFAHILAKALRRTSCWICWLCLRCLGPCLRCRETLCGCLSSPSRGLGHSRSPRSLQVGVWSPRRPRPSRRPRTHCPCRSPTCRSVTTRCPAPGKPWSPKGLCESSWSRASSRKAPGGARCRPSLSTSLTSWRCPPLPSVWSWCTRPTCSRGRMPPSRSLSAISPWTTRPVNGKSGMSSGSVKRLQQLLKVQWHRWRRLHPVGFQQPSLRRWMLSLRSSTCPSTVTRWRSGRHGKSSGSTAAEAPMEEAESRRLQQRRLLQRSPIGKKMQQPWLSQQRPLPNRPLLMLWRWLQLRRPPTRLRRQPSLLRSILGMSSGSFGDGAPTEEAEARRPQQWL
mmetsp:Transcript_82609/g.266419  ORF Transcript_82609/g.266419 Transcript_82609/m.266419 type:complete len:394 (-) Transcript_82609:525-1706(-)